MLHSRRGRHLPAACEPMPETAILSVCAAPPKPYSSSPRRPLIQPELVQQLPPARRLLVKDVRHGLHQHPAAAQLRRAADDYLAGVTTVRIARPVQPREDVGIVTLAEKLPKLQA